jgi:hypothetical protein
MRKEHGARREGNWQGAPYARQRGGGRGMDPENFWKGKSDKICVIY